MSLKDMIRLLTVVLLCTIYQSPVTARPNLAQAGTIFNDALNSEIRKDGVPQPDTLDDTPQQNFFGTIDEGIPQAVTEEVLLSTQDGVSLNQIRAQDNRTEDSVGHFEYSTSTDNTTDVVITTQLDVQNADVESEDVPSIDTSKSAVTSAVPNFEGSKILEDVPMNTSEDIIKLEEDMIKNVLETNPLLYLSPTATTTSESTNFKDLRIVEDINKARDDIKQLEDKLLKELEVLEDFKETMEEMVEPTESSLKFTLEDEELTSIESIFGGGASSIDNPLDELENVSDIFTESTVMVDDNSDDNTEIPNASRSTMATEEYMHTPITPNIQEDDTNNTTEEAQTITEAGQTVSEAIHVSIPKEYPSTQQNIDILNMPDFSLFSGDAPTPSPSDFEDLDAISSEYEEIDSSDPQTNIEYISETGSGDYEVDLTTKNSEIISEEIVNNGRFDSINILDVLGHGTTEIATTSTTESATTSTTEDARHSTEHFVVNFEQNKDIEESIARVEVETEKPKEQHHQDSDLYNLKPVDEVHDNILNLLPIIEEDLLPNEGREPEQTIEYVKINIPLPQEVETTLKEDNITEVPIEKSDVGRNSSSEERKRLPVVSRNQFDEAYGEQKIISTSDHSAVVEYRHSDSAEVCFEGSLGYQLIADIVDKIGNEKRIDTPKYKDTFKKRCVNSKFPVLRITQNYSSIELRFLLEPGYLFVDEISAMISVDGKDYQAVTSDSEVFIPIFDHSGLLRTNLHKEFIRERSKPEGTSMIVTLFDVQLTAHTSVNHEGTTEEISKDELQDNEANDDQQQDGTIHTAILAVTILLSVATLIIVAVLLVKIFLKYKSKKMVYILSVR